MNKTQKNNFYIDEIERLMQSYNIAQAQIKQIGYRLEYTEEQLQNEGINEERKKLLEEEKLQLEEKKKALSNEASRTNMISSILNDIIKSFKGKRTLYTEEEQKQMYLRYSIDLMNNNIEAYEKGYLPKELLELRKTSINEFKRELFRLRYLQENDIDYSINPHTNTGINSISKIFQNNIIIIIFTIMGFMTVDVFLSEVGEGSYKLLYTQPYKRKDIFFGKIISVFLTLISLFIAILVIQFLLGTIFNGIGDISSPYVTIENLMKLSLSGDNIGFKMIPEIKAISFSIILIILTIMLNICMISLLSIYTDSISKTISVEIVLILMTVLIRNFIFEEQIIHGLNPYSYIFTQDVLTGRINSSYLLGMILNIVLIVLCLLLSYMKFNGKDFLGDKE